MTINIVNDSYLIIVYQLFDDILVSDFSEDEKEATATSLNDASSGVKTSTGQKLLKLVSAGATSSIAQSMASKIELPNSVKGRIQSSLYDIIADGKISKAEVAEDFIGSCTNELDSTAIAMGFPTSQALYEAIGPDGAGVISKDFIKYFQKKSDDKVQQDLAQKNKVAQDITALKFKLVTGDNESWSSNAPSRKTQKGFNIVDAIENENITRDFQISIIQGDYSGIEDMYVTKAVLKKIWNDKIPFDIYVNDANNKNTEFFEHCIFNSISWESEGTNCLNCSINITQIPEYEVRTEVVEMPSNYLGKSTRKTGKVNSSKDKSTKVKKTEKKSTTKANVGSTDAQAEIQDIKNQIAKDRANLKAHPGAEGFYLNSKGQLKTGEILEDLRAHGLKGSLKDYGIK